MIWITGDTHGELYSRLGRTSPMGGQLCAGDTVLICGDFGVVWAGDKDDAAKLDWLAEKPFVTAFVPGNHENYALLAEYPVVEWQGAPARQLRPNVFELLRGEVYTIEGHSFFCFGGAASHDMDVDVLNPADPLLKTKKKQLRLQGKRYRVEGVSWWREELPSPEELTHGQQTLESHGWQVDYILTHCAPTSIQNQMAGGNYKPDFLTDFLEEILQKTTFRHWYFGHYHANRAYGPRLTLLYESYVTLEEQKTVSLSLSAHTFRTLESLCADLGMTEEDGLALWAGWAAEHPALAKKELERIQRGNATP